MKLIDYDQQDEQYIKIPRDYDPGEGEKNGKNNQQPEEFKVYIRQYWRVYFVSNYVPFRSFIFLIIEHTFLATGFSGPLLEWIEIFASKLQISRFIEIYLLIYTSSLFFFILNGKFSSSSNIL